MPPPLPNNVTDEGEEEEDGQFEDTNQDINHFGEVLSEGFLTENDYLNSEYYVANIFQIKNDLGLEVAADICQSKPKRTIDLRSGPEQVAQNPRKKAVLPPKQSCSQTQEKRAESGQSRKGY